jgi:hypothetical protein
MSDKPKYKLGRVVIWIATQIGFTYIIAVWMIEGIGWEANLARFMLWFVVLGTTFAAFSDTMRSEQRKKGRPVPRRIDALWDIAVIGLLAANGHFVYAAAWLWQLACYEHVYAKERVEQPAPAHVENT